jgi:hypothetical protein
MTAIVMRAVHRGIGAEQYSLRARLFNQPYYFTPATPGRFQIEIRLFTDMLCGTAASFRRAQIGVIEDDWHRRKTLGQTANMVRISVSWRTVTRDWTARFERDLQVGIEVQIIGPIPVNGGMELEANEASR